MAVSDGKHKKLYEQKFADLIEAGNNPPAEVFIVAKAKGFIADHSEMAILLIAAPLHIGTLEAVRLNR